MVTTGGMDRIFPTSGEHTLKFSLLGDFRKGCCATRAPMTLSGLFWVAFFSPTNQSDFVLGVQLLHPLCILLCV